MIVVSCGNKKATCCSITPVDYLTKLIKGSTLANIFVGPPGLSKLTSQLVATTAQSGWQQKKDSLSVHRAWLLVECASLKDQDEKTVWRYKDAVAAIDEE